MKKLLKWGGIALVVLIIIGAISGGSGNKTGNSGGGSNSEQKQEQEQTYKVNDTVTSKNMELTVTAVTERNSVGGQYINEKASEGGTLVVIQWQYKNTSSEPIGTFSQPSIKLVDSAGVEYSADAGKTGAYATEVKLDRKILSDLNPGIMVKDAQVFEVSKEAYTKGGWSVVIKADGKSYKVQL
jgi:hypothetical protein